MTIKSKATELKNIANKIEHYDSVLCEVYEMLGELYNEDDDDQLNQKIKCMMNKLEEI